MQALHFTTGNEPLAYALKSVGFNYLGGWNNYTDARLDHLAMPDMATAIAKGKRGNVKFCFEYAPDLDAALENWDKVGEAIKKRENIPTEVERSLAIAFVRIALSEKGQKEWENEWKRFPAFYLQADDVTTGPASININGMKIIGSEMPDAQRSQMFPQ